MPVEELIDSSLASIQTRVCESTLLNLGMGQDAIISSVTGCALDIARAEEMPLKIYRFDPPTGRRDLLRDRHACGCGCHPCLVNHHHDA